MIVLGHIVIGLLLSVAFGAWGIVYIVLAVLTVLLARHRQNGINDPEFREQIRDDDEYSRGYVILIIAGIVLAVLLRGPR